MKINLRGGGDIKSNPERWKSRELTHIHRLDCFLRGAGEEIPGPTRASDGSNEEFGLGAPQSAATGQEGALNTKLSGDLPEGCARARWMRLDNHRLGDPLPENIARWLKEQNVSHPPKDGAHE
jgi:hypothetical protein